MSSYNPNISDGFCFYDNSGNEAPGIFIPCGNSDGGHVSCCESQDNCLSSNACYNAQFGVTYLAGCTDKNYEDTACPYKGQYSGQTLPLAVSLRANKFEINPGSASSTAMEPPTNGAAATRATVLRPSLSLNLAGVPKPPP